MLSKLKNLRYHFHANLNIQSIVKLNLHCRLGTIRVEPAIYHKTKFLSKISSTVDIYCLDLYSKHSFNNNAS